MAGENPSAKQLRENDKKNAANPGPKSILHHSKKKGKKK